MSETTKNTAQLGEIGKETRFSSDNQPSAENKAKGIAKRNAKESLKQAFLNELALEVLDNGKTYTRAEKIAKDTIEAWDESRDPRYLKMMFDIAGELCPLEEIRTVDLTMKDIHSELNNVFCNLKHGNITETQAQAYSKLLYNMAKTYEACELEKKLQIIETTLKAKG